MCWGGSDCAGKHSFGVLSPPAVLNTSPHQPNKIATPSPTGPTTFFDFALCAQWLQAIVWWFRGGGGKKCRELKVAEVATYPVLKSCLRGWAGGSVCGLCRIGQQEPDTYRPIFPLPCSHIHHPILSFTQLVGTPVTDGSVSSELERCPIKRGVTVSMHMTSRIKLDKTYYPLHEPI